MTTGPALPALQPLDDRTNWYNGNRQSAKTWFGGQKWFGS
jgi:hypothetical protein